MKVDLLNMSQNHPKFHQLHGVDSGYGNSGPVEDESEIILQWIFRYDRFLHKSPFLMTHFCGQVS
jgi:hypothetical protein